jgi:hypothetical protein
MFKYGLTAGRAIGLVAGREGGSWAQVWQGARLTQTRDASSHRLMNNPPAIFDLRF